MMVTVNVDVAVLPHASDTRNVNLCSEPPDDTRLAAVVRISVEIWKVVKQHILMNV